MNTLMADLLYAASVAWFASALEGCEPLREAFAQMIAAGMGA